MRLGERDRSLVLADFFFNAADGAAAALLVLAAAVFAEADVAVAPVEVLEESLPAAAAALNSAGLGDRDCRPSFHEASRLAIKCDVAARPSLFSRRSCLEPPDWFGGELVAEFALALLLVVLVLLLLLLLLPTWEVAVAAANSAAATAAEVAAALAALAAARSDSAPNSLLRARPVFTAETPTAPEATERVVAAVLKSAES
jgi:hypothetical protein